MRRDALGTGALQFVDRDARASSSAHDLTDHSGPVRKRVTAISVAITVHVSALPRLEIIDVALLRPRFCGSEATEAGSFWRRADARRICGRDVTRIGQTLAAATPTIAASRGHTRDIAARPRDRCGLEARNFFHKRRLSSHNGSRELRESVRGFAHAMTAKRSPAAASRCMQKRRDPSEPHSDALKCVSRSSSVLTFHGIAL